MLVISLFLCGSILFQIRGDSGAQWIVLRYLYLLVAVSYLQAMVSLVLVKYVGPLRWLAQSQVVWDLVFATFLIYLTGGIASIFSSFYILVILTSVLLLSRRDVILVASAAAILYGSLINFQYYRQLPQLLGVVFPTDVGGAETLYTLFINIVAFLVVGILGGILVGRLLHSEDVRQQITIDYEELERLNRAILENLTSGLVIVDRQLRIRSLNAAAQEMLGGCFNELYNATISRFFPDQMFVQEGQFQVVSRGEGWLVDRHDCRRPIGYNTSILTDPDRQVDGLLVTFQDLTDLKEMEERLKRSDRLAAVGQLAAGLAHEIRNPLASISGSVQLLKENIALGEEDRSLMNIVVKEADRLNGLLREFLLFARPSPPEKQWFRAEEFVSELANLCSADKRFNNIDIQRHCSPDDELLGDRGQLRQALWNLLINAAEAMPDGGRLIFDFLPNPPRLVVSDTGPGIPEYLRQKIYDPFFTTKDHGTGLGLATVHNIVEAHGGTLELQGSQQGGASFVVCLPVDEADVHADRASC
ncbi:two-component system sensor histidine kinase NtrB [Syntrophotalea carbinolica]|nr:ATP-binding protein [Syntrophotalea carbinolica]